MPKSNLKNCRILVLEDEIKICKVISAILDKIGVEYQITMDGHETIEIYKKYMELNTPFNMLILDLTVIGGMGGVEVIKQLREINSEITAILSSGYYSGDLIKNHKKYGFKDILSKPYTADKLRDKINSLISCKKENEN